MSLGFYIHEGKIYKSASTLPTAQAFLSFHDDVFSKVDWKTEPEASLDNMYCRRAQQLRERYDRVILMYSGGSDSHNVFKTFFNNNIRLDEIHTFWPLKMLRAIEDDIKPDGYNCTLLREYTHAVLPRLKIVPSTTKVKVHDISEWLEFNYLRENFLQDSRQDFMVHNPFIASRIAYQQDALQKHCDSQQKTCVIFAADKPALTVDENDVLWFKFHDMGRTQFGNRALEGLTYTPELFYWTPDFPEIPIKQSHRVKRYMERQRTRASPVDKSDILKALIYPSTFEPGAYQQKMGEHHRDEQILQFFFGHKGDAILRYLKSKKITSYARPYEVGKLLMEP